MPRGCLRRASAKVRGQKSSPVLGWFVGLGVAVGTEVGTAVGAAVGVAVGSAVGVAVGLRWGCRGFRCRRGRRFRVALRWLCSRCCRRFCGGVAVGVRGRGQLGRSDGEGVHYAIFPLLPKYRRDLAAMSLPALSSERKFMDPFTSVTS